MDAFKTQICGSYRFCTRHQYMHVMNFECNGKSSPLNSSTQTPVNKRVKRPYQICMKTVGKFKML